MSLLLQGNALHLPLRDASVHLALTSPPYYGLRTYHLGAQELGHEPCHDCLAWARGEPPCVACYVCSLRRVAQEVWRVLHPTGVLFLNLGDSYAGSGPLGGFRPGAGRANGIVDVRGQRNRNGLGRQPGLKPKDLCGIPARVALALQSDGWYVRSEIVWHKVNVMPESVHDRPTRAHEQIYLLSKQAQYFYDADAIQEPGVDPARVRHDRFGGANGHLVRHGKGSISTGHDTRNARDVWTLTTEPTPYAHFATMPTEIARRAILAGTSAYGCCMECRVPWTRVVTRQRLLDGHLPLTGAFSRPEEPFRFTANGVGHWRVQTQRTAHGWQPGCACGAPVTPAVVLDPFCGSGTTVRVAQDLGRTGVGIDLSWEYLSTIARPRVYGATLPLFATGLEC